MTSFELKKISAGDTVDIWCRYCRYFDCEHYLEPVVRPTPKLHLTVLIVKGKPGDVYQTCRFENARRDVCARSRGCDNNIGRVSSVKRFAGAERELNTQFRSCDDHPFADDHHPRGGLEKGVQRFECEGFLLAFFFR